MFCYEEVIDNNYLFNLKKGTLNQHSFLKYRLNQLGFKFEWKSFHLITTHINTLI